MRKNQKGFTLIEMLAVVILLAILMMIAVGSYYSYIKKSRDDSFKIAENTIQNDVKNAYADCLSNSKSEFCSNHSGYGEKNDKIYLKELIEAGYSEKIKNPYDTNDYCDASASYVTVIGNNTDNDSTYLTCLVCGDKKSDSCENATIYVDTNGLTATITMEDELGVVGYGINQSEENEPSYIAIDNLKKVVKSYTSEKEGKYYVWVKNTLGNVSKAKFTLHSAKNDTIYFLAKEATYTGNPIEANIATSESGTLITYTYYNGTSCSGSKLDGAPIEPGNYSVKAVSKGNVNYLSGSKCVTHTILRSVPTLVLKEKSATYTGKPIEANKVEATNPNGSSVELAYTYRYYKDESCSVAFNEKVPTEAPVEVGTYYVKATSSATSTLGSMTTDCVKHAITEKQDVVTLNKKETVYNGKEIEANEATSESKSEISYFYYANTNCSGTALTSIPVDAGEYSVKAVSKGNHNYASGSICVTHTITKKQDTVTLTAKTDSYTGDRIEANQATSESESEISYFYYANTNCSGTALTSAPINAGNYSVKAVSSGNSNYLSGDKCVTHTIMKGMPTLILTEKSSIYTGSKIEANEVVASNPNGSSVSLNYTYNYYTNDTCTTAFNTSNPTTAPTNVGSYYVKVISDETDNLNSITTECIHHNITKKVDVITLENKDASYTGSEISHNIATSESKTEITYTYYHSSDCTGDKLDSLPIDVGFYSIKAESKGNSNYASGNKCGSHVITKGIPTISLANKSVEATGSIITIDEATAKNPDGSSIKLEYSYTYYNGTSCSGTALTSAPISIGEYSVKAISKETSNLKSGTSNCGILNIKKNTNNYLKNLGVSGYTMTPSFSFANSNYTITAEIGIKNINVVAEAMSVLSTVSGTGSKTLSWGNNNLLVYVTSQSGSIRTYKITLNNVRPTAPVLTGGSSNWVATAPTIKIANAGTALSGVKEYEYYKSSSSTAPNDGTVATGTTSGNLMINNEGTTYVWYRTVSKNGNKSGWNSSQVINLDTTKPTVRVSVSGKVATFTFSDNVGISGYGVNQSNTTNPSYISTTNTSATWTASSAGTYYAWVKDKAGNTNNTAFTIASTAFCAYNVGQTWDYNYTGGTQSFATPCNGTYQLEVWGAQGGGTIPRGYTWGYGGKGGYAKGNVTLSKGATVYVVVGGIGVSVASNGWQDTGSGYNGGGAAKRNDDNRYEGNGGGGATHMGTRNATLPQYGNTSGLYIVAGGGGGAGYYNSGDDDGTGYQSRRDGGTGGGTNGGTPSTENAGKGGTQSSGGISGGNSYQTTGFGQGHDNSLWNDAGAGGGGLYGGGSGGHYIGGGGGSGYIGGVSNGSMQNGVRSGNGFARITLISTS